MGPLCQHVGYASDTKPGTGVYRDSCGECGATRTRIYRGQQEYVEPVCTPWKVTTAAPMRALVPAALLLAFVLIVVLSIARAGCA
jgi:hypothetical protein